MYIIEMTDPNNKFNPGKFYMGKLGCTTKEKALAFENADAARSYADNLRGTRWMSKNWTVNVVQAN